MLTLDFCLTVPGVRILPIDGCERKLVLINTGFLTVGIWRGDVNRLLLHNIRHVASQKNWLIENAASVRLARKQAYAKGKAEGNKDTKQNADFWKACARLDNELLNKALSENDRLQAVITTLRWLDEKGGA